MTANRRWVILLIVSLLVLVFSFSRRKAREETAAMEWSATEASAALARQAEEAEAAAEGIAAEVQAAIEAVATAAAEEAGPPKASGGELCVKDVVEDAGGRLQADPDFPGQTIERQVLQDVDEDGGPEELVTFRELCDARNCSWAIYATNDGCPRYVGMLEGSSWTVLVSSHHDLNDIATTRSVGCAGAERYEAVLEYDGQGYRQVSSEYVNDCPPAESDL